MKVLIASSATGGHIYPALAIAEGILCRDPGAEILFVGAKWEIGKDIVKAAGYKQVFIEVSGFDRKNPLNNFSVIAGLIRVSAEIKKIFDEFRPDVVIGTGGHVAGPVIRAANKAGIYTVIQEQNVIPGVANKLAEPYADKIFVGFEAARKNFRNPARVIFSGNPVRTAFADTVSRRDEFREKYGIGAETFCVLIFGGSQGADAINAAAIDTIRRLLKGDGKYSVILITGRQLYAKIRQKLDKANGGHADPEGLIVMDFADAIYELYAASDLVVSRAGALTITEIALSGKASILVPSPNVTNNHQYYNAKVLADVRAAVLLPECELAGGRLASEIEKLAADPAGMHKMSECVRKTARQDSVKVIVDELFGSR